LVDGEATVTRLGTAPGYCVLKSDLGDAKQRTASGQTTIGTKVGTRPRFREILPRVYELKDLVDASHPDAYFQDFENGLDEHKAKLNAFLKLERQLTSLDDAGWQGLKDRAALHLISQTRAQGRGWQALFDVFSEACGFGYLLSIGCTGVHFIKRTQGKTPDLGATLGPGPLLCEVKTINISADEADRRRRIANGEMFVTSVLSHLGDGFLKKLTATLAHAVEQLDGVDPERKARRLVFTVVHFDDWVGDYQPQYFADMDDHLGRNPVIGAELVFCPASNLFERMFTMQSAIVSSE
jgi:hypothetical protein